MSACGGNGVPSGPGICEQLTSPSASLFQPDAVAEGRLCRADRGRVDLRDGPPAFARV